jgi:hypothetical protein
VAGAAKPVKHEVNKTITPNHLRPSPLDGFIEFEGCMRVESLAQVAAPAFGWINGFPALAVGPRY